MAKLRIGLMLIFLVSGLNAYTYEDDQPILQCPGCSRPILRPAALASAYINGISDSCNFIWSDMVLRCQSMPEYPWVVKCPRCSTVFWVEDATVIGDRLLDQDLANKSIDCNLPSELEYYSYAEEAD